MMGRRELFRRMAGAGIAAATVKPSTILAEASKLGALPAGLMNSEKWPLEGIEGDGTSSIASWQIMDVLDEERRWARTESQFMDFDIQSKKSWSPAFKSMIYSQREREMRDLRKRLDRDEKFLKKAAKMLGMER